MIITRTPMRISIAGGGTDLPSFYSKFGSKFTSAAIDKYIYIILQERKYYDKFLLKYSKVEEVAAISEIKNEIIRESLKLLKIKKPLEIVSFSEIGGETGLGSSGAFTVGVLNALHSFKGEVVGKKQLAEEACHIAIDILKQPSGKQDEYICAHGGLTSFRISKGGRVTVLKDRFDDLFIRELEQFLFMFYTGIRRESRSVLQHQKDATEKNDPQVLKNLKEVQKLGYKIDEALKNQNTTRFGKLMHKHWLMKRQRTKTTSRKIDTWYEIARRNGASGGKIMGAGGGGFFLFYSELGGPKLIDSLQSAGLRYVPFRIDGEGTKVTANFN